VGLINHILGAEKVAGKRVQRGCRLEPALLGRSSSASLSNSACCFFEKRELAWFLRGEVVGRHQTRAWRERESGPGTPKAMRAVSKVSVNLALHPSIHPTLLSVLPQHQKQSTLNQTNPNRVGAVIDKKSGPGPDLVGKRVMRA
jgi:hypothetical protein